MLNHIFFTFTPRSDLVPFAGESPVVWTLGGTSPEVRPPNMLVPGTKMSAQFSLSPIRNKYPDVTIQPDSRCIMGLGGDNTVSGLAAARAGNVHSLRPAGLVIIQLALASMRGYRR